MSKKKTNSDMELDDDTKSWPKGSQNYIVEFMDHTKNDKIFVRKIEDQCCPYHVLQFFLTQQREKNHLDVTVIQVHTLH